MQFKSKSSELYKSLNVIQLILSQTTLNYLIHTDNLVQKVAWNSECAETTVLI